jgi:hypothetical protein
MALPQERIIPSQSSAPQSVDPTREYVVAQGAFSGRIGQVVSNFNDDIEWLVGADVYERMAKDPTISKNLQFQKMSVASEGLQMHPAISDKKDPEYDRAQEILDFHKRSIAGLHRPVEQIIGEQLAALKRSHTVAEITYKEPVPTGEDKFKLLLRSVKVKPRNTTAFVIDEFRNVIGLTAWTFGSTAMVSGASITSNVIDKEKFAVLTFDTEDEDPRGINPLRAAYNFWQAKCLVPGLHLKWLEKSAIPSTVGFTADKAQDETGEDGVTKTAQEAMADTLSNLESGSSAAFPFGAKLNKIEVAGTGQQFTRAYQDFDTQLDYATSLQSGATKDSKSGSYSSKRIFKDVLDILIWFRKHAVAQVWYSILKDGTRYNFGEDAVHLTPVVMVGDEEGKDWALDATAASAIAAYLTDSQWLKLCAELGIPAPQDGEELPSRAKAAPTATNQPGDQPSQTQPPAPANQPPTKQDEGQRK